MEEEPPNRFHLVSLSFILGFTTVILVGIISEKNKSGESYYVLRLMEPITFSKGEKKVKVREIQLIIDDKLETEFAHLDYELCNITGSVFFTSEKQHHTKVILVVEEIRPNG